MKKILKSTLMLLCGACMFIACSDDLSNNPTLLNPATFTLNQPAYSASNIDLATSNGLNFTWSQPNYGGFPVAAEYQMQFSLNNSFTTSVEQAEADETGSTVADYVMLDQIFSTCQGSVDAAELAKGLQKVAQWEEDAVPQTQKIYARLASKYANGTIFSNVVEFNVIPYYVELSDAPVEIWYLVGGCIADGKWTNNESAIGTRLMPRNIVDGVEYDKKTGQGKIQYIGYFPDNAEFKIVKTPGDWDHYVFCGDGTDMGTSLRNGGDDPGNIKIANAGYYKITVDTKAVTCAIEKYEEEVKVYAKLCIAGSFNDWSDNDMTAVFNYDGAKENHVWSYEIEGGWKLKVKLPESWETNWGHKDGYAGEKDNDGNLVVPEGKWLFLFNDIDGSYSLIAK